MTSSVSRWKSIKTPCRSMRASGQTASWSCSNSLGWADSISSAFRMNSRVVSASASALPARLAVGPEFLILDEPTSALDVSVQAQVLNLLHELQTKLGLTYFFISHDLGVIRYVCDRVALIYRGGIVEQGETERIFEAPESDYARLLLSAMPEPDPDLSPFRKAAAMAASL